jgi:hypothetical protein
MGRTAPDQNQMALPVITCDDLSSNSNPLPDVDILTVHADSGYSCSYSRSCSVVISHWHQASRMSQAVDSMNLGNVCDYGVAQRRMYHTRMVTTHFVLSRIHADTLLNSESWYRHVPALTGAPW